MSDRTEYEDNEDIGEGRGWLPAWWVWMMYGGFAYALIYTVYMHGVLGWSQEKQYDEEVTAFQKAHPEALVSLTEEGVNPFRGDEEAIARGEKTYLGFCAACHKPDGTGLVGPNIVDAEWMHGDTDQVVYTLVMEGVTMEAVKQNPPKGPMPAHKNSLGAKKVLEVLAYLAQKNPHLKEK